MLKGENAKNPDWKVPMDLPSVKPEEYDVSIDTGGGSQTQALPKMRYEIQQTAQDA